MHSSLLQFIRTGGGDRPSVGLLTVEVNTARPLIKYNDKTFFFLLKRFKLIMRDDRVGSKTSDIFLLGLWKILQQQTVLCQLI